MVNVCLAPSGKGCLRQDFFIQDSVTLKKKKKTNKRKSTEKTCPHLEISTDHIKQCLFHVSERQEGFGAAERG